MMWGSGPGENIDIEDKINAAMDKIMKDPEEERNSSKKEIRTGQRRV